MYIRRDVYEYKIENYLFVSNETKGNIEIYDENNNLVKSVNRVPGSFYEFKGIANKIYNDMQEN
jgi:hypothetical protein